MTTQSSGAYIGTTAVVDVAEFFAVDVSKPEFKELLVRMYQQFNNMSTAVNMREAGLYNKDEFVNGQTFFANPSLSSKTTTAPAQRQVHRKVIDFGALPNTGTKEYVHNISIKGGWTFTRIYGSASDPVNLEFIPLPYASSILVDNIELSVNEKNVVVTTESDWSAYITTYIVLEYLKN